MGSLFVTIAAALVAGFVLLILEYRTGWFAERTSLTPLRRSLQPLTDKLSGSLPEWIRLSKRFAGFAVPVVALWVSSALVLFPGLTNYSGVTIVASGILLILAVLGSGTIDPPMGSITTIMILWFLAVAAIGISAAPQFGSSLWPEQVSLEEMALDWGDPRSVALFVLFCVAGVAWLVSSSIASHFRKTQDRLAEQIELLHDAPSVQSMLETSQAELLKLIMTRWPDFTISLRKRGKGRLADILEPFVPVGVSGYAVSLGCKTDKQHRELMQPEGGSGRLPPARLDVEKEMRAFYGKKRLTISSVKIPDEKHAQLSEQMKRVASEMAPLRIISATYGKGGSTVDVTAILNSKIVAGKLRLLVSNANLGGDPSKGEVKELRVNYVSSGQPNVSTVTEGTELVLP